MREFGDDSTGFTKKRAAAVIICAACVTALIGGTACHSLKPAASTAPVSSVLSTADKETASSATGIDTPSSRTTWAESTNPPETPSPTAPNVTVSPETVADSQWNQDMYPGLSHMTVTGFPESEAKWLGDHYNLLGYFLYQQCFIKYGSKTAEFISMTPSPKETLRYYVFQIDGKEGQVVQITVTALNSDTNVPFAIVKSEVLNTGITETASTATPEAESSAPETVE